MMSEVSDVTSRVFQSHAADAPSERTFGVFAAHASTAGGDDVAVVSGSATPFHLAFGVALMPAVIPRSQAYFWSHAWQAGETEAEADLAAGRSRVFDDPAELARYLLSAE